MPPRERILAQPTMSDPIVLAMIEALGLERDALPWEADMDTGRYDANASDPARGMRLLLTDDAHAILHWTRNGVRARYEIDPEASIVTLEGVATPETVLAAMTGRTLAEVIDMPGAERMRIVVAVNSRAFVSDPLDTRVQVERID